MRRADVLVRCNGTGQYLLSSGVGPNLYGPGVNLNFEFMNKGKPAAHLMRPGVAGACELIDGNASMRHNSEPKACSPVQLACWASQTGSSKRSWPPSRSMLPHAPRCDQPPKQWAVQQCSNLSTLSVLPINMLLMMPAGPELQ